MSGPRGPDNGAIQGFPVCKRNQVTYSDGHCDGCDVDGDGSSEGEFRTAEEPRPSLR